MVTSHEIEGLFAADLAYLQDFYGVINFGSQEEFDEFVAAQQQAGPLPGSAPEPVAPEPAPAAPEESTEAPAHTTTYRAGRASIEEIPTEAR